MKSFYKDNEELYLVYYKVPYTNVKALALGDITKVETLMSDPECKIYWVYRIIPQVKGEIIEKVTLEELVS